MLLTPLPTSHSLLPPHLFLLLYATAPCLTMEGVTDSQRRYLQVCPNQNVSLPCNPTNIDVFLTTQLQSGHDLPEILAKSYIPGACYHPSHKYCPTLLISCRSLHNLGYQWTLQGSCRNKSALCPPLIIQESCKDEICSADQYLCHPVGCVPIISSCNGACPNHQNDVTRQLSNLSPMGEYLKGFNLTETTEVTQSSGRSDRRILCGNSCLTKDEARNKYHCGGLCQVKSETCMVEGERACPQHFELCGEDTCIDSFVEEKWIASTGYPLYYSCSGECNHSSTPCLLSNNSITCPPGYWLCQDKLQCVLLGNHVRDMFFSTLCDGQSACMDGSDESFYQCLQVYDYEVAVLSLTLLGLIVFLLALTCCLRSNLVEVRCYGRTKMMDMQAKSYTRNEDEMYLRAVAPEDVD